MIHRIYLSKLFNLKIIKFLSAGVVNTAFGYFVFAGMLVIKVPYLIALFVATVAGVIFNYFSFGRIVFKGIGGRSVFAKFLVAYALIFAISASLLGLLTEYFLVNPYVGQILCIPVGVVLGWLLMNYWVYKND